MPAQKGETGIGDLRRSAFAAPVRGMMVDSHRHRATGTAFAACGRGHVNQDSPVGGGATANWSYRSATHSPPYSEFARLYDEATGFATYPVVRDAVDRSLARYRPQPRIAADVGCGTGLLLPYLASVAERIYAVDRSPAMLGLARARSEHLPVTLLRQDLRCLSLPEPVDLITCTFDTLNYLLSAADLARALQSFRRNLVAGGLLVFDLVTGAAWQGAPLRLVQRLRRPAFVATWRIRTRPARRLSIVEICIRDLRQATTLPGRREVHVQRWYPLALVRELTRRAGLTVREVRDLDGDRRATAASHWVHVVATR